MEGERPATRETYNHVAFKISEADYPACLETGHAHSALRSVKGGRALQGEGRSIYFQDDDNHLFETPYGNA